MKSFKNDSMSIAVNTTIITVVVFSVVACSVSKKTKILQTDPTKTAVAEALTDNRYFEADSVVTVRKDELSISEEDLMALAEHDTLLNGDIVMKNIKDKITGEEMIVDKLFPSIVITRFAQRQERGGNVPIDFQIRVPKEMIDNNWQVNLFPEMYLVNSRAAEGVYEVLSRDSLRALSLNGKYVPDKRDRGYRKFDEYMKQYERSVELLKDSLSFLDKIRYDIFLERNFTGFGYTPARAEKHYTSKWKDYYKKIVDRKDETWKKFVTYPYFSQPVLDTVIRQGSDFLYNYSMNVSTKGKPTLNKALIYMDGVVNHDGDTVVVIPRSDSLEFPISSIIDFVKDTVVYKVIYVPEHLDASSEYNILFSVGSRKLEEDKGDNAAQIAEIESKIRTLMHNDMYLLDSIVVTATASPEGGWRFNKALSDGRSASVMSYFTPFVTNLRDSLVKVALDSIRAEGTEISVVLDYDKNGNIIEQNREEINAKVNVPDIKFLAKCEPENWDKLAAMMDTTTLFTEAEKDKFFERMQVDNPDARENRMKSDSYYKRMKAEIYPDLRVVRFYFKLHLKETVNRRIVTDEIDELYMAGLEALKDRNWEEGLALLQGYSDDYNLGVAYLMMDRNENARVVFEKRQGEPDADYMLAIADVRLGREKEALDAFCRSYAADPAKFWRGNRDPEIRMLINKYQLKYNNNNNSGNEEN